MADAAKQIGSKPANFAKFPLILEFFHAGEIVGELIRTSLDSDGGPQYLSPPAVAEVSMPPWECM
jgi:hypothetical protein